MERMMAKGVTIYHNPKCSTSRQVLEMIEAEGHKPTGVRRDSARRLAPCGNLVGDAAKTRRLAGPPR